MIELIAGLVIFFSIHSISIFAMPFRNSMAEKNQILWKAFYSLLSLVGLVLLIRGYGEYRLSAPILYMPPMWFKTHSSIIVGAIFYFYAGTLFPQRDK